MAKLPTQKAASPPPFAAVRKQENCMNCRYHNADRCQRFPPQVVALGNFQSNATQPFVNPVSWCGEWRPKGFVEDWRKEFA
ncbi:MAG: hypothetical protein KGL39_03140 [Patescibacteria group bacterium]|nr:hypothetical protein [Patescibacteria group bacterium]